MPKSKKGAKKKIERARSPKFNLSESYASFILGFVVVVLVIILGLSFLKGKSHHPTQATSSVSTTQLPPQAIEKTMQEVSQNTYTVKDGDTLWSIAEEKLGSGFEWKQIADTNNISDPTNVNPGTKLTIPKNEQIAQVQVQETPTPTEVQNSPTPTVLPSPTLAPSPTMPIATIAQQAQPMPIASNSYTVVPGDTLWDISVRAYGDGFRWVDIAKANNLANPDLIFSGNVFTIPR